MTAEKAGRIVWHDLFTDDALSSRSFYGKTAGWNYVIERAIDFAWGGGERDFILALADDEVGAGFIEREDLPYRGWVPYIEVPDVDLIAEKAVALEGSVERAPFEVPGVGRNCLLRDPKGALLGICLSRHTFPAPIKQFGLEVYQARMDEFPAEFYSGLFDWNLSALDRPTGGPQPIARDNTLVGFTMGSGLQNASWIPSIRVARLSEALRHVKGGKGSVVRHIEDTPNDAQTALVRDQSGMSCCFVSE